MAKRELNATQVWVNARLSYAFIWEPDKKSEKYSTQLIIDKSDKDTLAKISAAIKAAKEVGKSKLANSKGFTPTNIKMPLHDGNGERPGIPEYEDKVYFNCTSKQKPLLANRRGGAITEQGEIYSGCYARVLVNFSAFSMGGNSGITAYLQAVQKVRDGEHLGGSTVTMNDFEDLGDEEVDDFMPLDDEPKAEAPAKTEADAKLDELLGI